MFALIRYTHVGNLLSTLGHIGLNSCRLELVPRSNGSPAQLRGNFFTRLGPRRSGRVYRLSCRMAGGCLSETRSVRNSYQVTFKASSTLNPCTVWDFRCLVATPTPLRAPGR